MTGIHIIVWGNEKTTLVRRALAMQYIIGYYRTKFRGLGMGVVVGDLSCFNEIQY